MKYSFISCATTTLASPPSRGAWIEIKKSGLSLTRSGSPPSRGAWIEMIIFDEFIPEAHVAPLAGGVD